MWTFFLILAIIGVIIILFTILIGLNEFEKKTIQIDDTIKKHYEKS